MADHYWLTENQLERIKPCFPRCRGKPRVDDRRVISGIIHVIRNILFLVEGVPGSQEEPAGGRTARQATAPEVKELRSEASALKEVFAELTLENRLLKKGMIGDGGDDE